MDHANFAPVRRISQVTRLLFPYALSPVTPGSLSAAYKCRFTAVAGFVKSGRLAAPTLCNEAESSSIALRLAGSPHRASPWGLLLSTPVWLHVGHLFDMLITFQINREASLGLAHRRARIRSGRCGSDHFCFFIRVYPCSFAGEIESFSVRLSPLRSGCGSNSSQPYCRHPAEIPQRRGYLFLEV
jgi:hypothetical protein